MGRINTRFGATRRKDRNRIFVVFSWGLDVGDNYPSWCCFGKTAYAVWESGGVMLIVLRY